MTGFLSTLFAVVLFFVSALESPNESVLGASDGDLPAIAEEAERDGSDDPALPLSVEEAAGQAQDPFPEETPEPEAETPAAEEARDDGGDDLEPQPAEDPEAGVETEAELKAVAELGLEAEPAPEAEPEFETELSPEAGLSPPIEPEQPIEPIISIAVIRSDGGEASLIATIEGIPEGVPYALQWQNDIAIPGVFADVPGETGESITFALTPEATQCVWRVAVTLLEESAALETETKEPDS